MATANDEYDLLDQALDRVAEYSAVTPGAQPSQALQPYWQHVLHEVHQHPTFINDAISRVNGLAFALHYLHQLYLEGRTSTGEGPDLEGLKHEIRAELIRATETFSASHPEQHHTPWHDNAYHSTGTHEYGSGLGESPSAQLRTLIDKIEICVTLDGSPVRAFQTQLEQRIQDDPASTNALLPQVANLLVNLETSVQKYRDGDFNLDRLATSLGTKLGNAIKALSQGTALAPPPRHHHVHLRVSQLQAKLNHMRSMYEVSGTTPQEKRQKLEWFCAAADEAAGAGKRWFVNSGIYHSAADEAALRAFDPVIAKMAHVRTRYEQQEINRDRLFADLDACIDDAQAQLLAGIRGARTASERLRQQRKQRAMPRHHHHSSHSPSQAQSAAHTDIESDGADPSGTDASPSDGDDDQKALRSEKKSKNKRHQPASGSSDDGGGSGDQKRSPSRSSRHHKHPHHSAKKNRPGRSASKSAEDDGSGSSSAERHSHRGDDHDDDDGAATESDEERGHRSHCDHRRRHKRRGVMKWFSKKTFGVKNMYLVGGAVAVIALLVGLVVWNSSRSTT